MSTLIITLPQGDIDASTRLELVLSADGQAVTQHDTLGLDLLPRGADEVVALVPAQRLSWQRVVLPAGSLPRGLGGDRAGTRLRAILDGLLEDQLLDDPAQVHLALQPQASTGTAVWVAACDRVWLVGALEALARAGVNVRRIVPECTPESLTDHILVAGDPDRAWAAGLFYAKAPEPTETPAAPEGGLLVCPLSSAALERLKTPASSPTALPTLPPVLAEPAVAALAERLCQQPVQLQQRAQRLLLAAQSPWNLAQFELANLARNRAWDNVAKALRSFVNAPQWRLARWAVVATVVVNLIGLNMLAWREKAQLAHKHQAVAAVLTTTFPRVVAVVDAPVQMAREVAALRRNSGQATAQDLESQLTALASAVPATHTLTSIDFEAGQLRAFGSGAADGAAVLARLKSAGFNASRQGEQWQISAGEQP